MDLRLWKLAEKRLQNKLLEREMFRFSRKMIYTVEAVLFVTLYGGDAPVQSRTITKRQSIPERYLEQTLQRLVRVGILNGVRGPRGGYELARPADRITVGEIVGVIRAAESREDNGEHEPSALGRYIVSPLFEQLDAEIMERLDRVTLADLIREATDRGLAPADALWELEQA